MTYILHHRLQLQCPLRATHSEEAAMHDLKKSESFHQSDEQNVTPHPGHRGMRQQTHSISSQQPAAKGHWTRAKTGRGALSYEQHG